MIYLLSEDGRRALKAATEQRLLYAFDFDGTLAPISPDRHGVTVPPAVRMWLQELAKRVPCAVVSGRSLADLSARIDGMVPHLIGNHGLEGPLSSHTELLNAERVCSLWKQEVVAGLQQRPTTQGAEVEDKRYSLTVHLRRTKDPDRAAVETAELLRQLMPEPQVLIGTYSLNVLPIGLQGKGTATLSLMTQLGLNGLLYVGDEETDETVFASPHGVVMGIRVGQSTGSHAGFYLNHQEEIEEVLRLLVQSLDHRVDPASRHGVEQYHGQAIVHGVERPD